MTTYGRYKWTVMERQLSSVQARNTIIGRNTSMGQFYVLDLPGLRQGLKPQVLCMTSSIRKQSPVERDVSVPTLGSSEHIRALSCAESF